MTDYYVDAENGANGNDGLTVGNAFQSLGLAIKIATASDTIKVVGGDLPANLYRTRVVTESACTIEPATAGDYFHTLFAIDVSEGASIVTPIDTGFEAWLGGGQNEEYNFYSEMGHHAGLYWNGSLSNFIQRTTDNLPASFGTYACEIDRNDHGGGAAGLATVSLRFYKPINMSMTISLWYKGGATSTNLQRQLVAESGEYWNNTTQAWAGATGDWKNQVTSTGTYQQVTLTVPAGSAGDPTSHAPGEEITLSLKTSGTGSVIVDDLEITFGSGSYSWVVDTGDTYVTDVAFEGSYTPHHMLKCLKTDWDALGADALRHIESSTTAGMAPDIATCRATPSSCFYNATTGKLYYTLASGETIADLHLEFVPTTQAMVNVDHAVNVTGMVVHGGETAVKIEGATANNTVLTDCHVCDTGVGEDDGSSFYTKTATGVVLNDCSASNADGFNNDATSGACTVTYNDCVAVNTWDDGFQSIFGGVFTANNCISLNNGLELTSGNTAFSAEGTNSTLKMYNCLSYKAGQNGVQLSTSPDFANCVLKNCVMHNSSDKLSGYDLRLETGEDIGDRTNNAYDTDTFGTHGSTDIDTNLTDPLIDTSELDAVIAKTNAELRTWVNSASNALDGASPLKGAGTYIATNKKDIRGRRRSVPTTIGPWEFTSGDEADTRTDVDGNTTRSPVTAR